MAALEPLEFFRELRAFFGELDGVRSAVEDVPGIEAGVVGSSLGAAVGLSVGYLIWLTRGGLLLASLLSSMPAWRLIDPLPVLSRLGEVGEDGDGESLDSMIRERSVETSQPEPPPADKDDVQETLGS